MQICICTYAHMRISCNVSIMQEEFSRTYQNHFRLLWHSTLPCFASPTKPDSAHLLRKCWWQGTQVNCSHSSTYNMPHQYLTQVNCSEIFIPVITDLGVCCGFNLGIDLKESEYSSLVKEMQVTFLIIL